MRPVLRLLPVVLLLPLSGVAACGSSTSSASVTATASSVTAGKGALASQVPAAIRSKGTLTVAADASYAPNEFLASDGKTVQGMDVDMVKAIGDRLGLTVTVVNAGFDTIIPGLTGGRYDIGASSFTDTKEREAQVDFVTYFSAGTSFYGKAGAVKVTSLDTLCGASVAVQKGTTQADDATKQKDACAKAGKGAVDVQVFDDQNGANLALSSARVQVAMADSPVAAYQVQQSKGALALSGQPYGTAPYGLALPKGNGMAPAVKAALEAMIKDGSYTTILRTWGVQDGAITTPVVNGATS